MRNGFTMIELLIVLAIIAVISAIILPDFAGITDRARLKSDIQSARIIQNAVELYDAERSTPLAKADADADIGLLKTRGYLKSDMAGPQTAKAKWAYDNTGKIQVDISGCNETIKSIAGNLSTADNAMVKPSS